MSSNEQNGGTPLKRGPTIVRSSRHTTTAYEQEENKRGLLVTDELETALEDCRKRVATISRVCRTQNRKFRDIEFDLENDRELCLHGVNTPRSERSSPSDVQRLTQLHENPQFFVDGADSNDIVQGALGDCWFLSAIATMSTYKGLVEKLCVARDELIGVYGFIFHRDGAWVVVIIDDLLYTSIPKFEELSQAERAIYLGDKEQYNKTARRGGKGLYFAKSGTPGETWVPLLEKAYAKLHGDYAALSGGFASEALEDLTGGVSTLFFTNDILDADRFWREELLRANKDRVFSCSFDTLSGERSGNYQTLVNGLISSHAYSVLKVVEVKGRRFVVIRNPWGKSEWTGPWSDGSSEWDTEWIEALPQIGHAFGDDGQFVMEYHDFLANWQEIERTFLFDSSWVMSSQWLEVKGRPCHAAWSYGDVSFTFSLPTASPTFIVLSQIDDRYFTGVAGCSVWFFDFALFKKGEKDHLACSPVLRFWTRSMTLEIELEPGDYVIHVRLDRQERCEKDHFVKKAGLWDERKLSRVLKERTNSRSVASNFEPDQETLRVPTTLKGIGGKDLVQLHCDSAQNEEAEEGEEGEEGRILPEEIAEEREANGDVWEDEPTESSAPAAAVPVLVLAPATPEADVEEEPPSEHKSSFRSMMKKGKYFKDHLQKKLYSSPSGNDDEDDNEDDDEGPDGPPPSDELLHRICSLDDSLFLGLRVYSKREAPVVVGGQLRKEN